MASSIKGIVIEIEGKTDGLVKALKDVEKESKDTQAALKKINEALKLDPKNVTLAAEKQKLLANEIQNTEQKLALLEQAAVDANAALANGDISEAEYANLQAEIEMTRQKLNDLNNEANNMDIAGGAEEAKKSFKELGEEISNAGENIKNFGEGMTKYVTGPIVAAGAASVAAFKDVDSSMDIIIKKTGATGEKLEEFEDIFNDISTTVPVDMDKVASAIGEVNTRFGVTDEKLKSLSVKFIEFSEINNTDVSQSVDNVQKALAAFGLDAEDAEALLDRLSYVSQNTGVSVDTLTSGLVQNAAAFQELNLDIDQAAQFMGELELSGANTDTVMQGLRKALKNAATDGTDLNTALSDLQDSIVNGTDDMDGLTLAYELFGKSGDQVYAALKNGTLDFNDLSAAAEEAGGTVTNTFKETNDPLNNTKTTLNKLKITLSDVGSTIATMITPAVEKLSDALEALNSWWNSLDESQQQAIITIGGVIAVIGPLIAIIGTVISSIGSLMIGLNAIGALLGTSGLAATIAALAPIIGTVVVVIVAAIAIIWGLYEIITNVITIVENWDLLMQTLGEDIGAVFESIKEWFDDFCQRLAEGIDNIKQDFTEMKEKIAGIWDEVKEKVDEVWEDVKTSITDAITNIKETVSQKIEEIKGKFDEIVSSAFNWGKDMISNFIDGLQSMWESFKGKIGDFTGYVKDNLGFSEPKEGPLSNFHTFAPDMIDLWNDGITQNLGKVEDGAQTMAATFSNNVMPSADYSGALSGISGQLAGIAGNGQAINVYIGSDRIGTAIARSNARSAYISGGR